MNAFLSSFAQILKRLFALTLKLYPAGMQREYAAEMQAVFSLQVNNLAHRSAWKLLILACREAHDLPFSILSAHFHSKGDRMHTAFPSTTDQTPWGAAFLSLLPFFIAGPMRIIVSYQPNLGPKQSSQFYFWFLLASSLLIAAGLVLGVLTKFPRWAYPYPIFLPISLSAWCSYAVHGLHWFNGKIPGGNSFLLFTTVVLVLLGLPGFRAFYRKIPQDWTLLSYGLFGFVLYLLSGIDFDESPRLTLFVLLPSLLSLCAALAHLRIGSAYLRVMVLLAGLYAGLLLWLLPIFQGMISIWIGIAIGLFMLLLYGGVLTAILLAPMLVNWAVYAWRAARHDR